MSNQNDVELPKGSSYLNSKLEEAKTRFYNTVEEFKKLLADKTHPDQQTNAYHNNVKSILGRLLSTSDDLDKLNQGEGLFSLIILCLRSSLKTKDEIIRLEVKIRELEREIKKINLRS